MLVLQNKIIKNGIVIPDIIVVPQNQSQVVFSAIDKIKYADFLALNPLVYVSEGTTFESVPYTGDAVLVPAEEQSAIQNAQFTGVIILKDGI